MLKVMIMSGTNIGQIVTVCGDDIVEEQVGEDLAILQELNDVRQLEESISKAKKEFSVDSLVKVPFLSDVCNSGPITELIGKVIFANAHYFTVESIKGNGVRSSYSYFDAVKEPEKFMILDGGNLTCAM